MAEIIKSEAVGRPVAAKLVKKEAFTAVMDAVTILDTAREQARAVLREAEARQAETTAEARLNGEAAGLQRYLEALVSLEAEVDQFYAAAEPELVRLAVGIARKIIGEELKTSPEAVVRIVREAVGGVRQARRVTIKCHASQVELLRDNARALDLGAACDIQVIAAPSVEPGGCLVESDLGLVDARLETQLRVIERLLTQKAGAA